MQSKKDLRKYLCKGDAILIPRNGIAKKELRQIGLKIISDTSTNYDWYLKNIPDDGILFDWYLVKLPERWSIEPLNHNYVQIIDDCNYIRVKIHIIFEQGRIVHLHTTVYSRFYVESRNYENETKAFLKDRLDDNFEMQICTCNSLIDEPCFSCERNCLERLSRQFPGCTDPARWDNENPLVEIKNAYLKKKA